MAIGLFMPMVLVGSGMPEIKSTAVSNGIDSSSGASSFPVLLPEGVFSGDLIIVFVSIRSSQGSRSFNELTGWTREFAITQGTNLRAFACYYRTATGAEGPTIGIPASGSGSWAAVSYAVKNHTEVQSATVNTGASSRVDPPNLSPSWGERDALWIAACCTNYGSVSPLPPPSGYAYVIQDHNNANGGDNPRTAAAALQLKAASQDPGTFGTVSVNNWMAATVAIRGK